MGKDSPSGCDLLVWIRDIPESTGRAPGQIIEIKDCPHRGWGKAEGPPDFRVVHIPDRRKADLQHLTDQDIQFWSNTPEEDALNLPPQEKSVLRRRWLVDLTAIDAADEQAIRSAPSDVVCELPANRFLLREIDCRGHALEKTFERKERMGL